ncbi:hypothetical protein ELI06_23645 [Rhizobium leguminosarum]|nr:hypothetical protein ELI06_23645 [Rhizobium leguminosarum]
MASYYRNRNAQLNGDHEVHRSDCYYLPIAANQHYLGEFNSCFEAVATAKAYDLTADGCAYCSPACHTR